MITLHHISKQYQRRTILADVTLQLETAKTHVFLGASGCGKTTLMRIIAGTITPDTGEVKIDDEWVTVADPCPMAHKLGFMTQEGGLFPHLRARENVVMMAQVRGVPAPLRQTRLEELATLVGLDRALLERYPSQLSGGQRQRVALMRALFQKPEVLLLDEPMGALDPLIRHELQETLKSVFTALRTTVVLVTHDVGEAAFFGDTITLLHEGHVLQHGTFLDLVHRPAHTRVTSFLKAQRPVPALGEIPA
jgi:osmoprotectant transport system ATP-binding protein